MRTFDNEWIFEAFENHPSDAFFAKHSKSAARYPNFGDVDSFLVLQKSVTVTAKPGSAVHPAKNSTRSVGHRQFESAAGDVCMLAGNAFRTTLIGGCYRFSTKP